jgi:sorbitol-specific phosphotransferase system component IIA
MLQTIEGIYKNGIIQLTELPIDIAEGRVIVTFLETSPTTKSECMMHFGMFLGQNQSTENASWN